MNSPAFHRLQAEDLFEIERQESQILWLGSPGDITWETAEILAAQPVAWTAWVEGRIMACFGISETFEGVQGVAWSLLSGSLGVHHLPLTRFMQREIAQARLARIELIAKAAEYGEAIARYPVAAARSPVTAVMADPTPECRFAALLGFNAAHVLRNFGAASETYMLFEKLGPVEAADGGIS